MTDPKADPKSESPTLVLHKFGSPACGPCQAMAKAQTVEKFGERHPEIRIVMHDIADAEWNAPKGSAFADAEKLAKRRKVKAIPTLIFEAPDGEELVRWEGGLSPRDMERFYLDALDELNPEDGDT